MKNIYLALTILGAVVPWLFLSDFFIELSGSPVSSFFLSLIVNPVSTAISADLIISTFVFFIFSFVEGRRVGMTKLWIYIPATLGVGLSFGLPLFLYHREKHLEKK